MQLTLATVALFGAVAFAQVELPECADACLEEHVGDSGCEGAEDTECLCGTSDFNVNFINCVAEGCESNDDIIAALEDYELHCQDIGVPIEIGGGDEEPTQI